MNRLDALTALLAKVEAGTSTRTEIEAAAISCFGLNDRAMDAGAAYAINDLNAALALHQAVLPGWRWEVGTNLVGGPIAQVWDGPRCLSARSENPARAWLIAILKAMIEEAKL